jgi:4'-phosphopantetheinyl transferase
LIASSSVRAVTDPAWPPSPDRPRLAPDTVDVWHADLAQAVARGREHELLSEQERVRAARFVNADSGRRWAAAHGILRALLGRCLDADPRALRFVAGAHGKPALAGEGGAAAALRFNLSHSGETALIALALGREVGVDVELPRRRVDHVAVARGALGEQEAQRLALLDPPEREREFLRAWVRWEAVLKCHGTGIGGARATAGAPEPWLHALELPPPAAAALAVERGPCAVRCWRWPAAGG